MADQQHLVALAVDGSTLSRDHIRRLMRLGHISRSGHAAAGGAAPTLRAQVVPNDLARQFAVAAADTWLGDLTTIATDEGELHLAGVLDLGGREVVGWAKLKSKLIHHQRYATRAEAHLDLFCTSTCSLIANGSTLGYQSPATYLAQWRRDNSPIHQTQT